MVEILDYIDPQSMFLMLIFLISFVMLQFSLSRVFKKSPQTGSMIAILVSILITYGLYYIGIDFEGFAFDLGFDMDMVILVSSILILIGFIYLLKKVGFGLTLIILGIGIIGISFFAYEQTITATIGIVILVLGVFFWWRRKKKQNKIPNVNYSKINNSSLPKNIKNPGRKLGMSLFLITVGGIILVGGLILANIIVSVVGGALLILGIIIYMAGGVFHLWDNKQSFKNNRNFPSNPAEAEQRRRYGINLKERYREFNDAEDRAIKQLRHIPRGSPQEKQIESLLKQYEMGRKQIEYEARRLGIRL